MTTLQFSKSTIFNRYPHLFLTIQSWSNLCRLADKRELRILSFGCSDGSEMASLSCYFPTASIFGCDISREGFDTNPAASRAGHYFDSTPDNILAHGPFDVIVANSVICAYPLKATIQEDLPFETFEKWVSCLTDALNPSGLLVLYNSSYFFQDSSKSSQFKPVRSPLIYSSGWVPKWTTNYQTAIDIGSSGEPVFNKYDIDLSRQIDCAFEKSGAGAVREVSFGVTAPERYEKLDVRSEVRAGATLSRTLIKTDEGDHLLKCEWTVNLADGSRKSMSPWFISTSSDSLRFPPPAMFDTLPPRPKSAQSERPRSSSSRPGFGKRLLRRLTGL